MAEGVRGEQGARVSPLPPPEDGAQGCPGAIAPWVEVLVDCPGAQGLYTYQIPPDLTVQAGDILSVPFGSRQVGAIAIRLLDQPPPLTATVKAITALVCPSFFSPTYWQLLEAVAHYYQTPLIQVIRTALPPGLLNRSQRRVRLCPGHLDPLPSELSPTATAVLTHLRQSPQGDYTWQYLSQKVPGAARALTQLQQRGWIETYLALPKPPRPQRRQALTLVLGGSGADLSERQREVLRLLQRRGGDWWWQEAMEYCRTGSSTLRALATKGYLVIEEREILRQGTDPPLAPDHPKPLTPTQATALAQIQALSPGQGALLHGVTGSGKTEVYLQSIAPQLAARRSALVLVPEIALTPQLTDRFRQRFGDRVCVYHSGLSEGERYDAWRRMVSGEPVVAIGTRSAIFAPLPHLGLIILDEEHDSSFKQDQPAPCYHARTVAYWRSHLDRCPLVLGSATPALETWLASHPDGTAWDDAPFASPQDAPQPPSSLSRTHHNAPIPDSQRPTLQYLSLPDRIHHQPLPPVTVVDMRQELQARNRSIFSRSLRQALTELGTDGRQGLLFIHRRGHSSFVSCRACGHVVMCPHCDVSLSHHQPQPHRAPTLRCHYCGHGEPQPQHCPACGSPYFKQFGSGTQRVEQALREEFPHLRPLRFDSDTTRTKGAHRALLTQFAQGEADVLVGTQMVTKGIDIPQVTLVGIMAADGLLYRADYRASERAFQTLTQVAGRAGRGDQPGRVILQTYTPEHPVIVAVQQQGLGDFLATELAQRQALHYPPLGRLVLLRLSGLDAAQVEAVAEQVAQRLSHSLPPSWEVLGPAPALVARVARRFRWQVVIKGAIAAPLPDLTFLQNGCPSGVHLTLDIDPLQLA